MENLLPKKLLYVNLNNELTNIIQEYKMLVHKIAHYLLMRLPANIHIDDLIQSGMIGLLEAYKNFDVQKGTTFESYASIRIRGSMLDEVRRVDWAPRSVHKNSRLIAETIRIIENQCGRNAKNREVAEKLNLSMQDYHQILQDTNNTKIFSFEDIALDNNCATQIENLDILDGLQREDFKKQLIEAINGLPKRERLLLALYYEEELTLREIGKILNVSESRVSQLHSQIMLRLKMKIKQKLLYC